MVILRRTRKLASALPLSITAPTSSTTALGDWYVNRLTVDRRPLLLLVSSAGLLPILIPAREVASLPDRLPGVVGARLQRLGIAPAVVEAEVAAMSPVTVAVTVDRSVLGILVEFARMAPDYLKSDIWDESTLPRAEAWLAETPCYASRNSASVIFPEEKASELLAARWGVDDVR
jgi:hypothetical protein